MLSSHRPVRALLGGLGLWAIVLGLLVWGIPSGAMSPADTRAVISSAGNPQITGIRVTPNPAVQGTSLTFNATVSGGTPPYTYSWTNTPYPCSPPGNTSQWSCTPGNTGQFTIYLNVTDSAGNKTHSSQPFSVVPPVQIDGISVNPNPVSEGSQFSVSASVSGGVTPYTYTWTAMPVGCSAGNVSSWSCSESSTGQDPIGLTVRDATGEQATRSASVNITSSGGNNGNGGNGNGNGNNGNKSSNGNNGNNNSNGFNLSAFGPFLVYGLIAGVVVFGLLVALTVGVIMIAVILSRRLPRSPKNGTACAACQATAPPGAKFCPACGASLTPTK